MDGLLDYWETKTTKGNTKSSGGQRVCFWKMERQNRTTEKGREGLEGRVLRQLGQLGTTFLEGAGGQLRPLAFSIWGMEA
jgi:hypothetical protein